MNTLLFCGQLPVSLGGHYGVLVVVHYYGACYCEIAETLVHVFTLGHYGVLVLVH
jgi:hypothetical protein